MTSLLQELGHGLPLGLTVFIRDHSILAACRQLFCWFGDTPLDCCTDPALFEAGLLQRKDQPLLILDTLLSSSSRNNRSLVEGILASGQVRFKENRKEHYFPVRALPTVITCQVSALSFSPRLILLDLPEGRFDHTKCSALNRVSMDEFRQAFLRHTQEHIDQLRSSLERGDEQALKHIDRNLSPVCLNTLRTLLGLGIFVDDFHHSFVPDVAPLSLDELENTLLQLLQQTTERAESCTGLAEQFAAIARALIARGTLTCLPTTGIEVSTDGLPIYYTPDALCFPGPAFAEICRRLSASRPEVIQALLADGALSGAPVNGGSHQTRIRIRTADGSYRSVGVHQIKRDLFNFSGDPLIFREEIL